jgi:Asp/Glu/hydantoin racemase
MKIIVIPPYRGMNWTPTEGQYMLRELVDNMKRKGQLAGVEITIDEGHPSEHAAETRDDAVYVDVIAGFLKRVRMYGGGDRYDAIVASAGNDLGFSAARMSSKIPVTFSLHSAVHVASLIGERFATVQPVYQSALVSRRSAENYGLGHKLASARYISYSTTKIAGLFRKYKQEGGIETPELKKFIEDLMAQYIGAIEEDRADTLLIIFPGLQCFEDEIRKRLDESGYREIPIICALSAAVEMAKAMVNMKLLQAPRAYPADSLKAKPQFA